MWLLGLQKRYIISRIERRVMSTETLTKRASPSFLREIIQCPGGTVRCPKPLPATNCCGVFVLSLESSRNVWLRRDLGHQVTARHRHWIIFPFLRPSFRGHERFIRTRFWSAWSSWWWLRGGNDRWRGNGAERSCDWTVVGPHPRPN